MLEFEGGTGLAGGETGPRMGGTVEVLGGCDSGKCTRGLTVLESEGDTGPARRETGADEGGTVELLGGSGSGSCTRGLIVLEFEGEAGTAEEDIVVLLGDSGFSLKEPALPFLSS